LSSCSSCPGLHLDPHSFPTRRSSDLLLGIILTSGTLSALLVNDSVCFMFTPLVVAVVVRVQLPLLPYVLALAMSANIGSVATLRSEEHTSELQSRVDLVCRLLLEKKK